MRPRSATAGRLKQSGPFMVHDLVSPLYCNLGISTERVRKVAQIPE